MSARERGDGPEKGEEGDGAAQDGLAGCDRPGRNPLKYSAMAGN